MTDKILKEYLKEIKTTQDIDIILLDCKEVYKLIENESILKDFYFKKVNEFNNYFNSSEYINDLNAFTKDKISKVMEKYLLDDENEIIPNAKIPIYNQILNLCFNDIDMNNSSGLIYAYSSIALSKELDYMKHIDFLYGIKSKIFCNIDYFLFDIICNPQNTKCNYLKYAKKQEEALKLTYLDKDNSCVNLIKIISIKIIKDCINYLETNKKVKTNTTNDNYKLTRKEKKLRGLILEKIKNNIDEISINEIIKN